MGRGVLDVECIPVGVLASTSLAPGLSVGPERTWLTNQFPPDDLVSANKAGQNVP